MALGSDLETKEFIGGGNPLHKAAADGHPRVVDILLDGGSYTNHTPKILSSLSRL